MKFCGVFCILVVIGTNGQRALAKREVEKEKQILAQLTNENRNDPNLLPIGTKDPNGPVVVNVSLVIKSFLAVDSNTQHLQSLILVRMKWQDPRIYYETFPPDTGPENITLTAGLLKKIWVPVLYFVNGIEKEVDEDHQFVRLKAFSGAAEFSSMMKLTTLCPMDLSNYPHDVQLCEIKISSYSHTTQDLVFQWNQKSSALVTAGTVLSEFTFKGTKTETQNCQSMSGEQYSCLTLKLTMARNGGYYCTHVFIPCTMLIIVSWLSYFLHPKTSATPRLVLTILALALAVAGVTAFNMTQAPKVRYTKAVDVWTGTTLTFILAALVEFVVVNYLIEYGCGSSKKKGKDGKNAASSEGGEQAAPLNPCGEDGKCRFAGRGKCSKLGATIDVIFRIGIPIAFLLFVVVYSLVYVI